MQQPHSVMIHEFHASGIPIHLDDEGDQMVGFYFQFTDEDDQPVSDMIGPYKHNKAAEHAALRAFNTRDFQVSR